MKYQYKSFLFVIKRHGVVLLLFLLLTIAFTWPLVGNLGSNWLAIRDTDTYVKLWDQWWLRHSQETGQSLLYTTDLFYPHGLDLTFHSISWIVAPVGWLLTPRLGPIDAYNVTILWAVFSTATAAYSLIYYLLQNRTAAFVGGLIYGFAPYFISHAGGHPDLVHLAPVPLSALLLLHTLRSNRPSPWLVAGTAVLIFVAALTSLYIMVFTLLTLGPVFLFAAWEEKRWRTRRFWRTALWLGGVTAVLLALRLWPIFARPQTLSNMIEAKYRAEAEQTDLLALVTPSHLNPLFKQMVKPLSDTFSMNRKWPAYLGIVPLLLTLVALARRQKRPEILLWFGTAVLFLLLALGPVLRVGGTVYDSFAMPASYLLWFPPIRAVGRPDFFVLGLLLPVGILAAYGFDFLWQRASRSPKRTAWQTGLMLTIPLIIFELWNGPFPGIPATVHPFYHGLSQQPEQTAVIELPMGRQESKDYLFYQLVHQKPIVEGLSARTPAEAYNYIEANPLLRQWRHGTWLNCETSRPELDAAVTNLLNDGFRYVILHHVEEAEPLYPYFLYIEPVVQDEELTVYDLHALQQRPFCP